MVRVPKRDLLATTPAAAAIVVYAFWAIAKVHHVLLSATADSPVPLATPGDRGSAGIA
jgi:hypothetical protein